MLEEPLATLKLIITHFSVLKGTLDALSGKEKRMKEQKERLQKGVKSQQPLHRSNVAAAWQSQLSEERSRELSDIINDHHERVRGATLKTISKTAQSLALKASTPALLLTTIRSFVERKYGRMLINLFAIVLAYIRSTQLLQNLKELDGYLNLPGVAHSVCHMLNQPDNNGDRASVRYHIFGHDHVPDLVEIEDKTWNSPPYRQWYINTGSWVPSFDEQERLIRGDVRFTFFRLLSDTVQDDSVPELLEWRPQINDVRPILIFKKTGTGFQPVIEDLPEVAS